MVRYFVARVEWGTAFGNIHVKASDEDQAREKVEECCPDSHIGDIDELTKQQYDFVVRVFKKK